jgi:hypothetical protein
MVEITGTSKAGTGMRVRVDVRLVGKGEVTLPGGRAGAGAPAVVAAGTVKQGQCLGFCVLSIWAVHAATRYMGAFIDSDHVAITLGTTSMYQGSAIKSILGTSKRLSLKLAG